MRTLTVLAVVCILGCGKEMARVPFASGGEGSANANLEGKEVSFWTDLDLEWDGTGTAQYEIELLQKGAKVASATCSPLARHSTRLAWVETNIGDHHTRRGQGKMSCAVDLPHGGDTVIEATLRVKNVTIRKADLVIKQ